MKLFVHAWYIKGSSAGFNWFWKQENADAAYEKAVQAAKDQQAATGIIECQYRYDFVLTSALSADEITDAIDAELDDRSESADVFWPENAKELTLATEETA